MQTFYQQEVYKTVRDPCVRRAKAVVRPADVDFGEQPHQDVWSVERDVISNLKMYQKYTDAFVTACKRGFE